MMGIDQTRHNNTAPGVYGSVRRAFYTGRFTDFDDVLVFNIDTAVGNNAIGLIECYDLSIGDQ